MTTPEARARQTIDARPTAAGWQVCIMADTNIHAAQGVAIREFPLAPGYGFADDLLYGNGKAAGVIEAKKEYIVQHLQSTRSTPRRGSPSAPSSACFQCSIGANLTPRTQIIDTNNLSATMEVLLADYVAQQQQSRGTRQQAADACAQDWNALHDALGSFADEHSTL